jgi:hypothetical protein
MHRLPMVLVSTGAWNEGPKGSHRVGALHVTTTTGVDDVFVNTKGAFRLGYKETWVQWLAQPRHGGSDCQRSVTVLI